MSYLQVAGFLDHSTVNGEGFRSVLFLSGCNHHCPGCHNTEMQDFNYGETLTIKQILDRILKNTPLIDGVTFSGGEPFEQSDNLLLLAQLIKSHGLSIWCYTGYYYEGLLADPHKATLLPWIEVLVDGPFMLEEKNEHLKYKGSCNQRILSLKEGHIQMQLDTLYSNPSFHIK